jgi:hypothetical protein
VRDDSVSIESPVDEARVLHGYDPTAPKSIDRNGYFSLCRGDERRGGKFRQRMHSLDVLEQVVGALGAAPDVYISQSSFVFRKRIRTAVRSTRAVWADIDCKKELDAEPEDFFPRVHARLSELGVALPTYTISSGNGLHLKWILREPVRSTHEPAWAAVQGAISAVLIDLAADTKVRDVTRVLRVLHSTNSGAKERGRDGRVQLLHQCGATYTLAEMSASLVNIREEQFQQIRRGRNVLRRQIDSLQVRLHQADQATDFQQLEHYVDSREAVMRDDALYRLNWSRFIDLRDLAIMRGGFQRGSRDMFLFWMVTHLALSRVIRPHNFHAEVSELIKAFPVAEDFQPLEAGYLDTLERRLLWTLGKANQLRRKNFIYTPTNDTLINLFQISDSEMSMLSTLISSAERERRNQENPRMRGLRQALQGAAEQSRQGAPTSIASAAQEAGTSRSKLYREFPQAIREIQQAKAQAREQGRAQALELAGQGLSQRQIAQQLGRPLSTVSLWLRRAAPAAASGDALVHQLGQHLAPASVPASEEGLVGADYVDAVMQQQRRERAQLRSIDAQERQRDLADFVARLTQTLKERTPREGRSHG